ncbi:MAG: hypothetical protein ACE5FI_16155 [Anaerolineales bacterium]
MYAKLHRPFALLSNPHILRLAILLAALAAALAFPEIASANWSSGSLGS